MVKNPWLWRLSFRSSEPKILHEAMFTGYTAIVGRRFAQAFQEYKPDLIVSVHPLMQHVPLKVLARMKDQPSFLGSKVPFATVVTDLTRCHRTWFHKQVDRCFVATQLVAAQAMRCESIQLTKQDRHNAQFQSLQPDAIKILFFVRKFSVILS